MERADQLFIETGIPITPRVGGVFAVDFALKGVSKETSVRKVLVDGKILNHVGLMKADIENKELASKIDIKELEIRLNNQIHQSKLDTIRWLSGIMITLLVASGLLQHFLK